MNEKDILEFARTLGKLKTNKRTGWKIRGISNCESVADHLFRAAVVGMVLSDIKKLDTEKILRMLFLHELEETVTGDIDALTKEKMNRAELRKLQIKALEKALSPLPKNIIKRYVSLWREVEEDKTLEAKFCKDIDKLEMMIQAYDYEKEDENNREKLKVFWTREDINAPHRIDFLIKIYEELRKQRGLK